MKDIDSLRIQAKIKQETNLVQHLHIKLLEHLSLIKLPFNTQIQMKFYKNNAFLTLHLVLNSNCSHVKKYQEDLVPPKLMQLAYLNNLMLKMMVMKVQFQQ